MRHALLSILLVTTLFCKAQPTKYEKDLATAVGLFHQMSSPASYEASFQRFEILSNSNPSDWLPPYYAAIVKVKMCLSKMGNQDQLAEEGLYWVARAKKIQINDEVYCAESMANTAKMSIHPTTRWFSYESRIKHPLALAKNINPKNPRIYILQANLEYRMPGLFGGGCKNALPLAIKADKLLLAEGGNKGNLPHWGGQSVSELLKACPINK